MSTYTAAGSGHLVKLKYALCHYFYPESARKKITPGRLTGFCRKHGPGVAWVSFRFCSYGGPGTVIDKN